MIQRKYTVIMLIACGCAVSSRAVDHPGEWKRLASMKGGKRQEMPCTHLDGKIYVAGGMNSSKCCNAIKRFEAYDIQQNSWKRRADLLEAVNHPGLVALDGKIYLISGYDGRGDHRNQGVTKNCYAYTPAADSWEKIAALPHATAAPAVTTYQGKIYVFGGDSAEAFDNNQAKTVYAYNPAKNAWRLVNDKMPHARSHWGAGRIGTMVYLSPGRQGTDGRKKDRMVQSFDLSKMDEGAAAWAVLTPLPDTPRSGYIGNWPVVNGKLYYIGGENPVTAAHHEFVPGKDGGTWRRVTDYPTPIHGIGPIGVGNRIYVCGGAAGGGVSKISADVYVYIINSGTGISAPSSAVQAGQSPLSGSVLRRAGAPAPHITILQSATTRAFTIHGRSTNPGSVRRF